MKKLILTNNPTIVSELEDRRDWEILKGWKSHEEIMKQCESLLLKEWHFAADPLGGYHVRPSPYRTMFFVKDCASCRLWAGIREWDILDSMRRSYDRHKLFLKKYNDVQNEEDYRTMDYSIAVRTLYRLDDMMF